MDCEQLPLELTEAIRKADKRNDTAIRIADTKKARVSVCRSTRIIR
jgi:hypothetical protein